MHFQCMNSAGAVQLAKSKAVNPACRAAAMAYGNGAAAGSAASGGTPVASRAAHSYARKRA